METTKKPRAPCRNPYPCSFGTKCKFSHTHYLFLVNADDITEYPFWLREQHIISQRNFIGEHMYPLIRTALMEGEEEMKAAGLWDPYINAGRITGMILEAHEPEDSWAILKDSKRLGQIMAEACEVLCKHAAKMAAATDTPVKR